MVVVEVIFWLSLAGVVYAYVGYPLVLLAWHAFLRRNPTRRQDDFAPSVSIVMAAYNEEAFIREKLENCLALDYPQDKLEIIIGSDACEDRTNAIVEEFADRGIRLCAYHPRRGKMATINRLVKEAQGDICVFSDVSEMFDMQAIKNLVRHFSDPSVGIVAGNHIFHKQKSGIGLGTRVYRQFKRFLWRVESRLYSTCRCDGPIYGCRRELYPFPSDDTINDDIAVPLGVLCRGKRIIFEPTAIVRGEVQASTDVLFRQKIRCNAGRYKNLFQFPAMFQPWHLRRFWIFMSHSIMPMLVPWFMVIALLTNAILCATGEPFYQLLFLLHFGFYLVAIGGYIAERRGLHMPPIAIPFYFVAANAGSLMGFFSFLRQSQGVKWEKLD